MPTFTERIRVRIEKALYPLARLAVYDPLATRRETPEEKIVLLLIKTTRDGDDGLPMTYLRGVLPSGTLLTLAGLVPEKVGDLPVETILLDETVLHVDLAAIERIARAPQNRVLVGICGIQSSQYDRALLLATRLAAINLPVLLGGFHIMGHEPTRADLMRRGFHPVDGEVEGGVLDSILEDFVRGELRPEYRAGNVRIVDAPGPALFSGYQSSYMNPLMHPYDSARGCSFDCSFCTVTTLMGRKMRRRSPERIAAHLRKLHAAGIESLFIVDDDAYLGHLDARKSGEETVFDVLTRLREEEGISFDVMAQADVKSNRDETFMKAFARAGGYQVFNGVESFDERVLKATGKRQNLRFDLADAVSRWHDLGVAYHMSAIIGFDTDTEETGPRMAEFAHACGVDIASWYVLTPLPGAKDYEDFAAAGRILDAPFNQYDGTHAVIRHPRLSPEQIERSFWGAYDAFYPLTRILSRARRAPERSRRSSLRMNLWYWYNACRRRRHPMMGGIFQLRGPALLRESEYPNATHPESPVGLSLASAAG